MNFKKDSLKPVAFDKLTEGMVANATLKSFKYIKDYAFATVVADGKSISCIIGSKSDYKIADLLPLKGMAVEITFGGTRVVDGVTYPKWYLEF